MKMIKAFSIIFIMIVVFGCQENITDPVMPTENTMNKPAPIINYTHAVGVVPFGVSENMKFTFYVAHEQSIFIAIYNDTHNNIRQMIMNDVVLSKGYYTITIEPSIYLERHEEYWITVWADYALNLNKSCVKFYYLD